MALGGQMDDMIGSERLERLGDRAPVANVDLGEAIVRRIVDRGQGLQIAGVGERVEVEHGRRPRPTRRRHTAEPMNPAPPVTSTLRCMNLPLVTLRLSHSDLVLRSAEGASRRTFQSARTAPPSGSSFETPLLRTALEDEAGG